MALLKKKKKKEIVVVGAEDVEKVLEMMATPEELPCPEIMLATHTCYCAGCPKMGTCCVERMSRSVGCAQSFSTYCSYRDSQKEHPTHGWADIIMKNVSSDDSARYGLGTPRLPIIKSGEEKKDVKKKSTGTTITSGFSGPDVSTA